jgi:hypothetical protein
MHQEKNIEWLVFNTKGFISLIDDELSRNIPPSLMNDYYIVMVNTYNTGMSTHIHEQLNQITKNLALLCFRVNH